MSVHTLFDTYIMVDWSAKDEPGPRDSKPDSQKKDNIWIGEAKRLGDGLSFSQTYCRTRARAYHHLEMRLQDLHREKSRVLVGFDFAFGYPAGFAELLTGKASWKAVWEYLAEHLLDDELNENNRFHVAGKVNQVLPNNGPFWGKPQNTTFDHLTGTSPWKGVNELPFGDTNLQRLRYTDQNTKGTQSVWKLYGAGSVGSQTLTGIPVVWQLNQHKALAKDSYVWPFENNFLRDNSRKKGRIVYAEIFPTLAQEKVNALMADTEAHGGKPKDQLQVWAMTEMLAETDESGELSHWLEAAQHFPAVVCTEEAAILQRVEVADLPKVETPPIDTATEEEEAPVIGAKEEPSITEEEEVSEKEAEKAAAKAKKEAERAARKAEKKAEKEAAKAEKEVERAARKAERETEKAARKAEQEKEKEARKAEREAEKAKRKAEKEKRRKEKEKKISKENKKRNASKEADKEKLKAKRAKEQAEKDKAKAAKQAERVKARAEREAARAAKRAAKASKEEVTPPEPPQPEAETSDAEE